MTIVEIIRSVDGYIALGVALWFIQLGMQDRRDQLDQMNKQRADFNEALDRRDALIRDLCDKD